MLVSNFCCSSWLHFFLLFYFFLLLTVLVSLHPVSAVKGHLQPPHTLMLWISAFKEPLGPKLTRTTISPSTYASMLTHGVTSNLSYGSWGALKSKRTCIWCSICKHRPLPIEETLEVWDDSSINQLLESMTQTYCLCVCAFFKGAFLSPTSWMLGCIVSMCVHPRHSRGPVPGSIQRRLGRTGDICWAQPGPNPRSIPRKAVAKMKDSPHSTLYNLMCRFAWTWKQSRWLFIPFAHYSSLGYFGSCQIFKSF